MPKMVFFKSFTKFGWVCGALLEIKGRPKFDEGIFESYVHLNLVVLGLMHLPKPNNIIPTVPHVPPGL